VKDGSGNPIKYNDPTDLFKDKDPRMLGSILYPFCPWQGGKVEVRKGIVKPDGTEHTFRGECHGEIIFEKRGNNGFGYDPIFYVPTLNKTFAELTPEQKNSISHRKESLEKFSNFLKEENNEN